MLVVEYCQVVSLEEARFVQATLAETGKRDRQLPEQFAQPHRALGSDCQLPGASAKFRDTIELDGDHLSVSTTQMFR